MKQKQTPLQREIAEKRRTLRETYGGLMNAAELGRELGFRSYDPVRRWARLHEIPRIAVSDKRYKYDVDAVAAAMVHARMAG